MSLLKEFLRIDSDRREALQRLRAEVTRRRDRIDQLVAESKRRRDEIAVLEESLHRLSQEIGQIEEEILGLDRKHEETDSDAHAQKVNALNARLAADRQEGARVADDYRSLRSEFQAERERLLAQADTGRMMDNYFQIETFLKDAGQPIPDAARKALLKERADLVARIGPLVAPPPSPDDVFRATVAYAGVEGEAPRSLVALGFPESTPPGDSTDLAATLLYGAYASTVEKLGTSAPRPQRHDDAVIFEMDPGGRAPEEAALTLFLAVEEGLKKAAAAVSVRCEPTSLFVEPAIASAVFAK